MWTVATCDLALVEELDMPAGRGLANCDKMSAGWGQPRGIQASKQQGGRQGSEEQTMNVRSEVVGERPTRQSRRLETRLTQTNVHLWRASGRPGLCHTEKHASEIVHARAKPS